MIPVLEKYYKEPLYRNSIAIMLNTASGAIFGFLFWIVAARLMPSEDLGLATAIISAGALITTLSKLGMDSGLIRFLPMSDNKDDLYSTTLLVTLAISAIITLVFIALIDVFSPSLAFIKVGIFPLVLVLYVGLNSINNIQNVVIIAARRGDLSFLQNLILGLRIPLLVYVASLGVMGIFTSYETVLFLTFVFGMYVIHKLGINFRLRIDLKTLRESIGFSLGNYTATIFMIIPSSIIPILIINMIGAKNSAYFSIAYSISGILSMIAYSISTSLFVEGSYNVPLKQNIMKSYKFIFMILIPSVLFTLIFGDKLLLIFSKEYAAQAYQILQLLAISTLFSGVSSVFFAIKRIQRDVKTINILNLTSSIILITLSYVLMTMFGLMGVGYAWLITNSFMCLIILYIIFIRDKMFEKAIIIPPVHK